MSKKFDREALLELPHKDIKARFQALFGEPPRSPNKVWMVNQMQEERERRKAAKKAEKTGARARAEPVQVAEASPEPEAPGTEPPHTEEEPVVTLPASPEPLPTAPPGESLAKRSARANARAERIEPAPANEPEAEHNATEAEPPEAPTSAAAAGAKEMVRSPTRERGRYKGMTIEELRVRYDEVVGRPTSSTDKHYLIWKILQAEKGRIRVGPVQPGQRREGDLAHADKTLPLTLTAPAVEAMDAAWRRMGFPSRMNFMRAAIREQLTRGGETAAAALFGEKGAA